MWDQMWAKTSQEISEAAIYQDIAEIHRGGQQSLMLGRQQLEVARLGSMAGSENTAAAAQQAFNNTLVDIGQSTISAYGSSLMPTKGR